MNIKHLLIGSAAALACLSFSLVANAASPGADCPMAQQTALNKSALPQCDIPNQSGMNMSLVPVSSQACEPAHKPIIAMTDPFPGNPAIKEIIEPAGGDQTVLGPQLAEAWGGYTADGADGGKKKPNLLGPQLASIYPTGWGLIIQSEGDGGMKKPIVHPTSRPIGWGPQLAGYKETIVVPQLASTYPNGWGEIKSFPFGWGELNIAST